MPATAPNCAPAIRLASLLGSEGDLSAEQAAVEVRGICDDSRDAGAGMAFAVLRGRSGDGARHAEAAVAAGAKAVLAEEGVDDSLEARLEGSGACLVRIDGLRERLPRLLERAYPLTPGHIKLIAVTGSNGKSTVVDLLRQLLPDCASIGSNGIRFGEDRWPLRLTTTTVADNFRQLHRLEALGARYVAMEASSIGIDQGRLDGLPIDIAVFTNLSRDHLDYHQDMESYAACKLRLFEERNLEFAMVNLACPTGRRLADSYQRSPLFSYQRAGQGGLEAAAADFVAEISSLEEDGARFELLDRRAQRQSQCHSALLCPHNVDNLLAALAVCLCLNLPGEELLARLARLSPCPGRAEAYRMGDGRRVLIDYAHSPDALEKLLDGIGRHGWGRLCVVFGCGGGRDRGKRAMMAQAVARHAARIVVTSDNPRDEDPEAIIADILVGLQDCPVPTEVIGDRRAAIAAALGDDDGMAVVIAGRGNESHQQFADYAIAFDDLALVKGIDGGARATAPSQAQPK